MPSDEFIGLAAVERLLEGNEEERKNGKTKREKEKERWRENEGKKPTTEIDFPLSVGFSAPIFFSRYLNTL